MDREEGPGLPLSPFFRSNPRPAGTEEPQFFVLQREASRSVGERVSKLPEGLDLPLQGPAGMSNFNLLFTPVRAKIVFRFIEIGPFVTFRAILNMQWNFDHSSVDLKYSINVPKGTIYTF